MKSLLSVILTTGLSITASAQSTTASLPVRVDRAYEVVGFDGLKPHSRGTLTFSTNAIQFAGAKASAAVPIASIPRYSLNDDSKEVVPGAAGWLLQSAPLFINPLVEAGSIASGLGLGMLRTRVSALEFDYVDSSHGSHKALFLVPRNTADSARLALSSLNVPMETVAPVPHPTFSKDANLLGNRVGLGKGVGSIRVADPAASDGGMPPFLEALLYEQLISQLKSSGYFSQVLRAGEDVPIGSAAELYTLQIKITAFGEGKPRLRLATLGFGKARITAEVQVSDSSNTLLRHNIVNATVSGDQNTFDASWLLAARVAKLVTKD
jgi:hypothetical protein